MAKILAPLMSAAERAMNILQTSVFFKQQGVQPVLDLFTARVGLLPNEQAKIESMEVILDGQINMSTVEKLEDSLFMSDVFMLAIMGETPSEGLEKARHYKTHAKNVWQHLEGVNFDFEEHQKYLDEVRENLNKEIDKLKQK